MLNEIPHFKPGPERELLCFKEEALHAFDFLTKEYDFICVRTEITFIRYESQNVFVHIFHGRGSYEIGVEIGLLAICPSDEVYFTLADILHALGIPELPGYFAVDREQVQRRVRQVAELIREHMQLILHGDPSIFEHLRQSRAEWSDNYSKQIALRQVRENADRAWRARDYDQMITLYGSINMSELTRSEARKLDYARKKLGQL